MTSNKSFKSGYVAIIGKPNAGKSTLMNNMLGSKLSIATHKAQTTRHQVVGIHSDEDSQIIFLDTPGIINPKYELQKAMMKFVEKAEKEADLILYIFDATYHKIDEEIIEGLKTLRKPIFLILNKIDLTEQESIAQLTEKLIHQYPFKEVIPISALHGEGVKGIFDVIKKNLPVGPPFYPDDILSEHPVRFFVSELIREQIFLQYHEEIPYSCTVEVIQYEEREDLDYINAEVIVNRNSQKGMIIGKGGQAIKKLGSKSRESIEQFIDKKVFLDLHVKVRDKWRDNENMLRNLGYN